VAIQFRCYCKKSIIILLIFTLFAHSDYLSDAYNKGVYQSKSSLEKSRANDLKYNFFDPECCCNNKIMDLFRNETEKFEKRINPAIDIFIESLSKELEQTDLIYKELQNYKVANAIYSFSDLAPAQITPAYVTPQIPPGECLVKALDFNNETDRDYYMHNIINRFESGGSYSSYNSKSGAYGRYQFIPSTGASYCAKVGGNCCQVWHSDTPEGRECQDKMFIKFTQDNASQLSKYGVPTNSATIYIAHQQGVGGLLWLRGGKNPYNSFARLKQAIVQNTYGQYQNMAKAATTEDELRQAYIGFWNSKFGCDIMGNVGNVLPLKDFTEQAYKFNKYVEDIQKLYREGILKEQMNVNYNVERIKDAE